MTTADAPPKDTQRFPEMLGPYEKPGDRMSFEELRDAYNLQTTSGWIRLFVRLLLDECRALPPGARVLDIGCGKGIARRPAFTRLVSQAVGELHGVEPDPSITPEQGVFAGFQHATLEDADLPERFFDLSYSFMVVEHVADPDAYMRAVARSLKPGGEHFFITVNGHHHFAKFAKWSKRLGIEDALLRLLRGKQSVEGYHYPVQYRMNTPGQIRALAGRHGFGEPEFVFLEEEGAKPYFPGPLRPLLSLFMLKRRLIRRPDRLLTMIVRVRKAEEAGESR